MKKNNGAFIMSGVVFAFFGLVFFLTGAWIAFFLDPNAPGVTVEGDPKIFGIVFMLFSSIFIAIGVWQIVKEVKSANKNKRLVEQGTLYWAQVTNISQNFNVAINGRSPYFVECSCVDAMGLCRNFVSHDVMRLPSTFGIGSTVAVYVNPDVDDEYCVDVNQYTPAYGNGNMQYGQGNYQDGNYQGGNYPNYPGV